MELTQPEAEFLEKISKGKDRKTIADEMVISVNIISVHIRNLHQKSKTHSYTEFALLQKKHPQKIAKYT